ncbi:MAG: XRE family transcriptional regulator [Clostridia bacterium]|nr:XRE family transcriptional regulator [Clostridia bacterium]
MVDNYLQIASRIKELRVICGLSVAEIAEGLGVSEDVYNGYENSGENIPISALYYLANRFGVDMTDLLTGKSPKLDTLSIVKKTEGLSIDRYSGYMFEEIAYKFKNRKMEPMIVHVDPLPEGNTTELVTHGGQEMNFVLKGSIALIYDDAEYVLNSGDCSYFDPTHPHGQKALGGKQAVFLTVICE